MLSGNLYTTKIDKVSEKPTPLPEYAIRATKIPKGPVYLQRRPVFFAYRGRLYVRFGGFSGIRMQKIPGSCEPGIFMCGGVFPYRPFLQPT